MRACKLTIIITTAIIMRPQTQQFLYLAVSFVVFPDSARSDLQTQVLQHIRTRRRWYESLYRTKEGAAPPSSHAVPTSSLSTGATPCESLYRTKKGAAPPSSRVFSGDSVDGNGEVAISQWRRSVRCAAKASVSSLLVCSSHNVFRVAFLRVTVFALSTSLRVTLSAHIEKMFTTLTTLYLQKHKKQQASLHLRQSLIREASVRAFFSASRYALCQRNIYHSFIFNVVSTASVAATAAESDSRSERRTFSFSTAVPKRTVRSADARTGGIAVLFTTHGKHRSGSTNLPGKC
jgi:hypothetical protein